ncbi:S10 family peptidase [Pseudoduganella aquatica]|uniref:Carboxypeptidase n=1 Tax=Pseudoduganella aquatica TaxID=2660641 RepID=A0A7X4H9N8_9BURK|nr:carboxypeptidase [Pseudoduganella aquatica]MYN06287.1 carboxypeptidase [Pseudoduganella aquatica]
MKSLIIPALLLSLSAHAQQAADSKPATPAPAAAPAQPFERALKAESAVSKSATVMIKGKAVPYKVTAGTQPVWDKDGKVIASLFYTYYQRSDVADKARRPLVLSFNGGPGSASVWMHVAYTGPKMLNIDDEGYPVQPYGVRDNPHSILDVADILYVDPVNTGFSRILDSKADRATFFGVNADISYLAEWLNTFVSREGRWTSPKYLIGESYGTARVAGLSLELQNAHWMYLNGVILVSPTELGLKRDGIVGDALNLPYYAATAWYQKALPADLQARDLKDVLPEVEAFTVDELIPALAKGGFLDSAKKAGIAAKVARYSGIGEKAVLQHNLVIPTNFFWKELLRDQGYTVGRLDSRYKGIDKSDAGASPDYNAELTSWLHSFTPAINHYLRDVLQYKTDIKYNMFGSVHPWDNKNDTTGENLRKAMAMNPYMKVMVQSGYYDGATTYFDAKYTMWQLDPSGKMKDRLRFEGYRSGHMMYLRSEDLVRSTDDIRDFIKQTTPAANQPARY